MAVPQLEVRHYKNTKGVVYLVYRYLDDKYNNFEYQVYQLVETKLALRKLGISDEAHGRNAVLNSREMGDKLFKEDISFPSIVSKRRKK